MFFLCNIAVFKHAIVWAILVKKDDRQNEEAKHKLLSQITFKTE